MPVSFPDVRVGEGHATYSAQRLLVTPGLKVSVERGVEPRPVGVVGLVGVKRRDSRVVVAGHGVTRRDGVAGERNLAGRELAGRELAGLVRVRGGRICPVGVRGLLRMLRGHVRLGRGRWPPVRHRRKAVTSIKGQPRRVGKGGQRVLPLGKGRGRVHGLWRWVLVRFGVLMKGLGEGRGQAAPRSHVGLGGRRILGWSRAGNDL